MSRKRMLFAIFFLQLYFNFLSTALALYECSYDNTINITNFPTLTNGSYIYDNEIIADNLVSDYNYEILYDGTNRSVPMHKRACICHLKPCIPICSDEMINFYQYGLEQDEEVVNDIKNVYSKNITLANKENVKKNLIEDFAHIVLTEFCEARYPLATESDERNAWTLFEDGTLLRHSDEVLFQKNTYCFDLHWITFENKSYPFINPFNCYTQKGKPKLTQLIHYWTQALSVPLCLLTIIAYICLPELRNVHGKCFMTYLSCLTISYSIISINNLSPIVFSAPSCLLMGYISHYMQLTQYTWLGIISLDIWKSFADYDYKASYHAYALYGYNIPLIMTFLTFLTQYSSFDDTWKPGINDGRCGLNVDNWAAIIYLYGPCSIILICCLVFFILTSKIIKRNDEEVFKISHMQFESPRTRYGLYLRLFVMMGFSLCLDITSYFLSMFGKKNCSEIFDYINALQGLYVFVNFLGRARVRKIIIKRFFKRKFNNFKTCLEINFFKILTRLRKKV